MTKKPKAGKADKMLPKDTQIKRNWDPQEDGGSKDTPSPQVVHLGQGPRSQRKQKPKVSDHAPSKNQKTTSRCSRNRVMEHTPI